MITLLRPRWRRPALGASSLVALACVLSLGAGTDPQHGQGVEDARATLEKWVETRRLISQEKRDWAIGREVLEDRIALVQQEIEARRARIDEAQANITEADRKRDALEGELQGLQAASGVLLERVAALEARTLKLLALLPEPIREKVLRISQQIPEDPGATEQSLSERFLSIVGCLNEIDRAQREVSVTTEVRSMPDGGSMEVSVLYVGIGQGYYVDDAGRVAGVGSATPEGWAWTPANELAPRIARAIAIQRGEQPAEFVPLPIRVD